MKYLIVFLLSLSFTLSVQAQNRRQSNRGGSELNSALRLVRSGRPLEASAKLFNLAQNPAYKRQNPQIRYILGMMLAKMQLRQLAAFQFISVINSRNKKYLPKSLEKLYLIADDLGDDTLLNYALSKVTLRTFPRAQKNMLYFRIGESQISAGKFKEGIKSLRNVSSNSDQFYKAKYLEGLAMAELGRPDRAVRVFSAIVSARSKTAANDPIKAAARSGLARAYYQDKKWNDAIKNYVKIPKDSPLWHEIIFELGWSYLRAGKFRSALSQFQTLHSSFYEDFYQPESLILRSIVYLYICRYDEMGKVLDKFVEVYKPAHKQVKAYLASNPGEVSTFNQVQSALADYRKSKGKNKGKNTKLPFLIVRKLGWDKQYVKSANYIKNVEDEIRLLQSLPAAYQKSGVGQYGLNVLKTRISKAKKSSGKKLLEKLNDIQIEIFNLMEQEGFARYEMINSNRKILKQKISGNYVEDQNVDKKRSRSFYVKNGYEYWPFQGENWIDELGNYHYLGGSRCQ